MTGKEDTTYFSSKHHDPESLSNRLAAAFLFVLLFTAAMVHLLAFAV
jgi:hypothetical protein